MSEIGGSRVQLFNSRIVGTLLGVRAGIQVVTPLQVECAGRIVCVALFVSSVCGRAVGGVGRCPVMHHTGVPESELFTDGGFRSFTCRFSPLIICILLSS